MTEHSFDRFALCFSRCALPQLATWLRQDDTYAIKCLYAAPPAPSAAARPTSGYTIGNSVSSESPFPLKFRGKSPQNRFRRRQNACIVSPMSEMRLYDIAGNRLYLTAEERTGFLAAARRHAPEVRTFAETLHWTGCRISEALEITPRRVDLSGGRIILRSLKKRREDVYRSVPVPPDFLDTLSMVHSIREALKSRKKANAPLWGFQRQHGWRLITGLMIEAGIPQGPHRTPKGLRHGFGINATVSGVPLNMLRKWMGHATISTTAIYADAIGKEEQNLAARMWA